MPSSTRSSCARSSPTCASTISSTLLLTVKRRTPRPQRSLTRYPTCLLACWLVGLFLVVPLMSLAAPRNHCCELCPCQVLLRWETLGVAIGAHLPTLHEEVQAHRQRYVRPVLTNIDSSIHLPISLSLSLSLMGSLACQVLFAVVCHLACSTEPIDYDAGIIDYRAA